jgi:hypothetical protein
MSFKSKSTTARASQLAENNASATKTHFRCRSLNGFRRFLMEGIRRILGLRGSAALLGASVEECRQRCRILSLAVTTPSADVHEAYEAERCGTEITKASVSSEVIG